MELAFLFSNFQSRKIKESLKNFDCIDFVLESKKLSSLPAEYTEAPKINHLSLPTDFYAPLSIYNFIDIQDFSKPDSAKKQEFCWASQFSVPDTKNAKVWAQYHIEINELAALEWLDELIATTYMRQNQYIGNAMSHYDDEYQSCQCLKS